jgi:8-oxo-dGTP pyrophosphatase MutT (NUDIX family)
MPERSLGIDWLTLIRARLAGTEPRHDPDDWRVPGLSPEESQRHRELFPANIIPAAVLVPLVARPEPTVLLTQRAPSLRNHAGQISFPGGRIEPGESVWAAALREAREEIGLEEGFVELAGYLSDHILLSGFRVTPVVGIVQPGFSLRLSQAEVQESFEVPLTAAFDPVNQHPRLRRLGEVELTLTEVHHGGRTIWGATAGMLLCLGRLAG